MCKKYNPHTKGYKIDIYVNGTYYCSTDWAKTCKAAKLRFLEVHKYKLNPTDKVKAVFFRP